MNTMTRKKVLISLLLVAILAAAFGYYLFNKGPVDVKSGSAIKLDAIGLYEQFDADSTGALKNYSGKILQVAGLVTAVSLNQKKEKIILLKTNTGGASVNCTMEEDPGEIKINDTVSIKGICSGIGQGDEDLGIKGDVYLTRCFLIK
jgi:cytochrome c-type biogenesis protein CcmE